MLGRRSDRSPHQAELDGDEAAATGTAVGSTLEGIKAFSRDDGVFVLPESTCENAYDDRPMPRQVVINAAAYHRVAVFARQAGLTLAVEWRPMGSYPDCVGVVTTTCVGRRKPVADAFGFVDSTPGFIGDEYLYGPDYSRHDYVVDLPLITGGSLRHTLPADGIALDLGFSRPDNPKEAAVPKPADNVAADDTPPVDHSGCDAARERRLVAGEVLDWLKATLPGVVAAAARAAMEQCEAEGCEGDEIDMSSAVLDPTNADYVTHCNNVATIAAKAQDAHDLGYRVAVYIWSTGAGIDEDDDEDDE